MATKSKDAKRVITLEDIKFNKENAVLAAVACIPPVGLVLLFVEKNDLFVRYYAAQFAILGLAFFLITFIVCLAPFVGLISIVMVIMGAMKAYKGERWDIGFVSNLALDLMNRL